VIVESANLFLILLRIHELGGHAIESTVNLSGAFLADSTHV